MGQKRVYEIAKTFGVSSEAIIKMLHDLGKEIKSAMGVIDDASIESLNRKFEEQREAEKQKEARKKEIDEKVKQHEAEVKQQEAKAAAKIEQQRQIAEEKVTVDTQKDKDLEPAKKKRRRKKKKWDKKGKSEHIIDESAKKQSQKSLEKQYQKTNEKQSQKSLDKTTEPTKRKDKKDKDRSNQWSKKKERDDEDSPKWREFKRVGRKSLDIVFDDEEMRWKKRKLERKKEKKQNEMEVKANIKKTLTDMESTRRRKYKRRTQEGPVDETEVVNKLKVSEFVSVAELSDMMKVPASEVISACLDLGLKATMNQRLSAEEITLVADEFGYEVEILPEYATELLEEDANDSPEQLRPRPPIITIMGHVDHGKTTLLDRIRESNIVAGEAGGITQRIGAYSVEYNGSYITFLDTPGHEAFSTMRARGAHITDIVVLVVAADDRVMPQTIEAIDHAKAAGVPIVVAINKIDLPMAEPQKVRQELANYGLLDEKWGGKTIMVDISARTGEGVDKLLELLLLQAEMMELKANPFRRAKGVVIDAKVERGRGIVATVLVQKGTLKIGDPFVVGLQYGKVRAMYNERGKNVESAGPSFPVEVLGLSGTPQAGDTFIVTENERKAKEIYQRRVLAHKEYSNRKVNRISLNDLYQRIQNGTIEELKIILKGDVSGSVEALSDSIQKLNTEKVKISIIHKGIGGITESDVFLAAASSAIIIGFNVRPTVQAQNIAKQENVDIRTYQIIYEAIEDIKSAMEGLLKPVLKESIQGTAQVKELFKTKAGPVAGCVVLSGQIANSSKVRILRGGMIVGNGKITSLKKYKEDVKSVPMGQECGMMIEGFDDIQKEDVFESYIVEEVAQKL